MNVYILLRKGKGVDITGRFCDTHKKIQRGDIVTDKYDVKYVVDDIVITKEEPDELVYLHLNPGESPDRLIPDDIH